MSSPGSIQEQGVKATSMGRTSHSRLVRERDRKRGHEKKTKHGEGEEARQLLNSTQLNHPTRPYFSRTH